MKFATAILLLLQIQKEFMKKLTFVFCLLFIGLVSTAQIKLKPTKDTTKTRDTIRTTDLLDIKENGLSNIPTISIDDNDLGEGNTQAVSSVLTAGRDPFLSAAAYSFSALRFRLRGYEADNFKTYINGVPMETLDRGYTPYATWGGLNDVLRNKDLSFGLRASNFSFGELGEVTSIDARASKQRKQTEIGYSLSNRNYVHKLDITHSTGISKNGWAFSFSLSTRYANEAYFPGTDYRGWSWFAAADKRIGQKHLLSLVVFGSPTQNGRQGYGVKEAFDLTGSHTYNPYWGWQNGKKRSANISRTNQPVAIFSHDYRINNSTSLLTAVSASIGDRGSSAIDWYHADNPSPLYYRYLPSYWDDPNVKAQLTKEWQTNDAVRQINWTKMYDANRGQKETFNGTTGLRSRYVQFEYLTKNTNLNFNTTFNTRIGSHTDFTAGASFQYQKSSNYKKLLDLLGGDYFVDLNQFAERVNIADPNLPQSDLLHPNRIVRVGDDYGYNYDLFFGKGSGWIQAVMKYNKVDYFIALEASSTSFYRKGNYKNGLFPTNSLGKSATQNFTNYAFKTGMTYKLNGRNYFYGNIIMMTQAPFFDNVFTAPRFRNTTQENITNEKINSIEAGYTLNAPKFKLRLTGYYTEFKNQMNVLSFFDDVYSTFVNYGITGINKVHSGGELGVEAKVLPNLTANAAVAVGRFYYSSNQNAVTTIDNDASIVSRDVVYAKNYYVGGSPQEAYNFSLTYRSPKYWQVGLSYSFFDNRYLEINPLRRTPATVQGLVPGSTEWHNILDQQKLGSTSLLDLYVAYSYKLPSKWKINNKNTFLNFSLNVNNLLNNKDIVINAFENPRYDPTEFNLFPSKYNYTYGLNYTASVSLRF